MKDLGWALIGIFGLVLATTLSAAAPWNYILFPAGVVMAVLLAFANHRADSTSHRVGYTVAATISSVGALLFLIWLVPNPAAELLPAANRWVLCAAGATLVVYGALYAR